MRWIDEILGTNWKHRILKPSTLLIPSIIGWTCDKSYETDHFFVAALIAGIIASSAMVHDNIKNYNSSRGK